MCRLGASEALPTWASEGPFVSITWTDAELSVVCSQEAVPTAVLAERGWRCLRVPGRSASA